MVVFNSSLNNFARKYLIKNINEDKKALANSFVSNYNSALSEIAEHLLLYDKVSIKVYGENIPLVVLINELGIEQVFELVEEEALEFILWTPVLTTLENDDLKRIAMPFQSGNLNSPVHCIPEESLNQGLKSLKNSIDRKLRRDLVRKVIKVYKTPNDKLVHHAADLVVSAYQTNKLQTFGLQKDKDIMELNYSERFALLALGDEILETAILSDFKYSSFGNYLYYSILDHSFDKINNTTNISEGFKNILGIEKLPDIPTLLNEKRIDLKKLIAIRRKKISKEFRGWMERVTDKSDSEYVTKQYIEDITSHKGPLDTKKGKFIKTMGMYAIGATVGNLVGGIGGAYAGVAFGKILEPVADLGLDFIVSIHIMPLT